MYISKFPVKNDGGEGGEQAGSEARIQEHPPPPSPLLWDWDCLTPPPPAVLGLGLLPPILTPATLGLGLLCPSPHATLGLGPGLLHPPSFGMMLEVGGDGALPHPMPLLPPPRSWGGACSTVPSILLGQYPHHHLWGVGLQGWGAGPAPLALLVCSDVATSREQGRGGGGSLPPGLSPLSWRHCDVPPLPPVRMNQSV